MGMGVGSLVDAEVTRGGLRQESVDCTKGGSWRNCEVDGGCHVPLSLLLPFLSASRFESG